MNILHKAAFQGTPLARSVFGPIDVLMELKAKDVQEFVEDNFKGPRMALVAAGGVPHGLMEELGNKYFGNASTHYSRLFPVDPEKPCRYTGSEMMFDDYSLPMTYGAIAVEGVGWNHPDRIPLQIATAMTGSWSSAEGFGPYSAHHVAQNVGWTMGHEGPCHNFHAFNHSYKNDGLFGVYHETSEDAAQAVLFNILKYWKHMCTKCQDDEVLMGKNLLKSHLAKSMETTHAVANDIGRQTLDFTNRKSLHELFSEIDAVTTDRLHEACMNNIWDRDPVSAAIGRVNAHHYMNYMQIRSQMSWWRY
jgi:processing peptidase subunit beta